MRQSIRFFCSKPVSEVVDKISKTRFKPEPVSELRGEELIDEIHRRIMKEHLIKNPRVPTHPGESGYPEALRESYRPDPMRNMRR